MNTNRKLALAALVAATLLLTGCASTPVARGRIVKKEHEPAQYGKRDTYRRSCTGSGTKRRCRSVKTGTERYLKKSECYEFELANGWEGCVSKDTWNKLDVRDIYDSNKY